MQKNTNIFQDMVEIKKYVEKDSRLNQNLTRHGYDKQMREKDSRLNQNLKQFMSKQQSSFGYQYL